MVCPSLPGSICLCRYSPFPILKIPAWYTNEGKFYKTGSKLEKYPISNEKYLI
jgi:hypothetical protein